MSFSISYVYEIVDRYSANLNRIKMATSQFGDTIKQTSEKAAGFGTKLKGALEKFGNVGTLLAGAGITAGATTALNSLKDSAITFETAMAEVIKATDLDPASQQFKSLRKQILETSVELGKTPAGVAAIVAQGAFLGIPIEKLGKFSAMAGAASVAFGITEEDAGNTIAKLGNMMSLSTEQTGVALDAINTLADRTAASGAGILDIMGRISGNMSSIRMPAEMAAGWAAFAQQITVSPELGASGLNMLIRAMQKIPEEAKKLKVDPNGAIISFLKRVQKADQATVFKVLGDEAGQFAVTASSKLNILNDALKISGDRSAYLGSMQNEVFIKMGTAEGKIAQATSTLELMKIAIGDQLLPVLKELSPAIMDMFKAVADFAGAHPTITRMGLALGALVIAFGVATTAAGIFALALQFTGIGEIILIIMAVAAGITLLSIAIHDNMDWLNKHKMLVETLLIVLAPLIGGISLVVGAFLAFKWAIYDNWEAIKIFAGTLKEFFLFLLTEFDAFDNNLLSDTWHYWAQAVGAAVDYAKQKVDGFVTFFNNIKGTIFGDKNGGGLWNNIKDFYGFGISTEGGNGAMMGSVSAQNAAVAQSSVGVNGQIWVTATGGAAVQKASMETKGPGDLGMNIGG